jgi:hypothetical protein
MNELCCSIDMEGHVTLSGNVIRNINLVTSQSASVMVSRVT